LCSDRGIDAGHLAADDAPPPIIAIDFGIAGAEASVLLIMV
jgi:hypothetical protein